MNKKTMPIMLAFFLACSITNAQTTNTKDVSAKLDEVTLYYRSAELVHSATTSLGKGENEVWINGLASNINVNSLKINATGGIAVSSYEFITDHKQVRSSNPVIKTMQDSLEFYNTQLTRLNAEKKVSDDLASLLQKGMQQKVSNTGQGMTLTELKASLDYYQSKSVEMEMAKGKREIEIKNCENSIARLQDKLTQSGQNGGTLHLKVVSPSAVTSQITISYVTSQAGWAPYYSINAVSTDQPIQIVSKARVSQTTGITWNQVKMTLSTGSPNMGKTAPLFQTWFLENVEERPQMAAADMVNSYSYEEKKQISRESEENATMDNYLSVSDNQLTTTYSIDLPYTIPGDGNGISIDLRTQSAKADFTFYCAPKLDSETFLLAELQNSDNLDLPKGLAQVTFDGMYVGETVIDGNSTDNNVSLTMGTDKRISVKREKVEDFSSRKVLGSTVNQIFTYQITVKNNQKRKIKLKLKDQYPVSSDKSIEVKLLDATTKPTDNVAETGVLTWEDEFSAGETKTYRISYSVKYPKDYNLNL